MDKKEIYIDFLYNRIIYTSEDRTEKYLKANTRELLFKKAGLFLSKMRIELVKNILKEGNNKVLILLSNSEEKKFNAALDMELERINNMTIDEQLEEVKSPLAKALLLMNIEFKGKVDKGGEPYINHLRHVFYKTRDSFPNDIDKQCAAILHDLIEDIPDWNKQRLLNHFNERTVSIVISLTKLPNESYPEYIKRLVYDIDAVDIKIEDLEHNMDIRRLNTLTEQTFKNIQKYHIHWKMLKEFQKKVKI